MKLYAKYLKRQDGGDTKPATVYDTFPKKIKKALEKSDNISKSVTDIPNGFRTTVSTASGKPGKIHEQSIDPNSLKGSGEYIGGCTTEIMRPLIQASKSIELQNKLVAQGIAKIEDYGSRKVISSVKNPNCKVPLEKFQEPGSRESALFTQEMKFAGKKDIEMPIDIPKGKLRRIPMPKGEDKIPIPQGESMEKEVNINVWFNLKVPHMTKGVKDLGKRQVPVTFLVQVDRKANDFNNLTKKDVRIKVASVGAIEAVGTNNAAAAYQSGGASIDVGDFPLGTGAVTEAEIRSKMNIIGPFILAKINDGTIKARVGNVKGNIPSFQDRLNQIRNSRKRGGTLLTKYLSR